MSLNKYSNIADHRPPGKTWLHLYNVLNGQVYCGELSTKPVVMKEEDIPEGIKPMHFTEKCEHGKGALIIATHFINP